LNEIVDFIVEKNYLHLSLEISIILCHNDGVKEINEGDMH
jgi:hypothetical protein